MTLDRPVRFFDFIPFQRGWEPIRVAAFASAILLVAAGISLTAYSVQIERSERAEQAGAQARILAASVSGDLAFDDVRGARDYLNAVLANPAVEGAAVYDSGGRLYAQGTRPGQTVPAQALGRRTVFEGAHLIVVAPVTQAGVTMGSVYLRTAIEPAGRRLARYAGVALLAALAALVIFVLAAAHGALSRANQALEDRAGDLAAANDALTREMEERAKAEEALRQGQKMEALGKLTGGVAHDFNNLLMVASGGLELLDRTEDPDRRRKLKDGIREAVDRGARLTRQLLAFSRRSPLHAEVVDLGPRLDGIRVLLDRSLREDIGVRIVRPTNLWPVEIDPGEFDVALLNIAVNARDAMPKGGEIKITARNLPAINEEGLVGDFVELSIADQGEGMTSEVAAQVFEPFFTTKAVGQGTGLGLSQVYGFVRASGGRASIESKPGEGTILTLLFPRAAHAAARAPAAPAPAQAPLPEGKDRRILLVDDDDSVAAAVEAMLEELGYRVVRASDAGQALTTLDQDRGFDIVLSDMVMPGEMGGIDLAREIARRHEGLPVVLSTGYSDAAAIAVRERVRLLTKPYRLESLAAELDAAVAEGEQKRAAPN
jgi:signal transduction histidine kinase/ActR/RegA family two-component response regulator